MFWSIYLLAISLVIGLVSISYFALRGRVSFIKFIIVAIISFIFLISGFYIYTKLLKADLSRKITWGVTFSQKFSNQLGLNWKENLEATLKDLGVQNLRVVVYWDLVEPRENQFAFADLDYQIELAQKYSAKVIIIVGQKVPRWPECHYPQWTEGLSVERRDEEFLKFLSTVVRRYKSYENLLYWQVENEPFLPFGECPKFTGSLVDKEINTVKSIDGNHSVLVTDSGELGLWYFAAKRGDVFGTTMYRRVHNDLFGNVDYRLPPGFFILKERVVRFLLNDNQKKFIVSELAMEPWLKKQLYETTIQEQFQVFDLAFFKDSIEYAKAAGFDEYYLWGAEWWYYLKVNGNSNFWDAAKKLF